MLPYKFAVSHGSRNVANWILDMHISYANFVRFLEFARHLHGTLETPAQLTYDFHGVNLRQLSIVPCVCLAMRARLPHEHLAVFGANSYDDRTHSVRHSYDYLAIVGWPQDCFANSYDSLAGILQMCTPAALSSCGGCVPFIFTTFKLGTTCNP